MFKIAKMVACLWILISTAIFAQSVIAQAVKETINLAPRAKKGDLQRYWVDIESASLDSTGAAARLKADYLAFAQVCRANTPERGLEYEITVDSFIIGQFRGPQEDEPGLHVARQYDNLSFQSRVSRNLGRANGCYDIGIRLPDSLKYLESWDLLEYSTYFKVLELARFSVGNRLKTLGDTATFVLPGPICHRQPGVLYSYRYELRPLTIELHSLSTHRNRPCAVLKIRPTRSPYSLNLSDTPGVKGVQIDGTIIFQGEFRVALDNGQIVAASLGEQVYGTATTPDGVAAQSQIRRVLALRQIN